jgi:hypothetical protein
MYGTYLRLNVHVHDGWRTVIRVASQKLTLKARRGPAHRQARQKFYRQMLQYHRDAQHLVRRWRL